MIAASAPSSRSPVRSAYLNTAAEGLLPRSGREALLRYADDKARGDRGRPAMYEVEARLRTRVAGWLEAAPEQVTFVPSAARGVAAVLEAIDWRSGDSIVTGDAEFPTNVSGPLALGRRGVETRIVRSVDGRYPYEASSGSSTRGRAWSSSAPSASGPGSGPTSRGSPGSRAPGARNPPPRRRDPGVRRGAGAIGTGRHRRRQHLQVGARDPRRDGALPRRRCSRPRCPPRPVGAPCATCSRPIDSSATSCGPTRAGSTRGCPHSRPTTCSRRRSNCSRDSAGRRSSAESRPTSSASGPGSPTSAIRTLASPEPSERAGIIAFETPDPEELAAELGRRGIVVWGRDGRVRLSPHLYTTAPDVERALEAIADVARS